MLIVRHAMESSGPTSPKPIEPLGIAGSATFNGQLRGSLVYPQFTGQLSSSNFQYRNTALTELQAGVALSPSSITLTKGQLRTSEGGQVQFDVAAGLTNWAYSPQSPVRLDLTAERLPVAAVERLANLHYPVSGTLAAHVSMHGSQSNVIGQGSATLTRCHCVGPADPEPERPVSRRRRYDPFHLAIVIAGGFRLRQTHV